VPKRRIAVSAALALAAATLTPIAAHADTTQTTYYVNDNNTLCNDAGAGTEAAPFCTIQEAVTTATTPGDTVIVEPGNYSGEVKITASGTAADPITFEAATPPSADGWSVAVQATASTDAYGLYLDGASYINVSSLEFGGYPSTTHSVEVENSSHVTLDRISTEGNFVVSGDSGNVTISRSEAGNQNYSFNGSAFEVDSSGTGNVITTSLAMDYGNGGAGVTVDGSAGADITSNTILDYCGAGIAVGDDSNGVASGATIENNVVEEAVTDANDEGVCTAATTAGISVQSAADESGLTANYNDVYPEDSVATEVYEWAGTAYQTPADLDAATGQGAADSIANPEIYAYGAVENESSPVINAANSNAPGELSTDLNANARVYDPNVPETGAGTPGYDRGAVQYVETLRAGNLTSPSTAPSGTAITINDPTPTDNWANAAYTYKYDFGDGSTDVTTTGASVTHTYASTGSYTITVTVTSGYGATSTRSGGISILKPVAFSASFTAVAQVGLSFNPDFSVTTDWPITSETLNYGDGTATVNILAVTDQVYLFHTYAQPGTYTVTYTVADYGGDTKTITDSFTTAGSDYFPDGPTRLLDTRTGLGGTSSQLSHDGSIKLKIVGNGSIPTDATAVELNLTVVSASGNGYIQADEGSSTGTSNLNYRASSVYTNSVVATVGSDGTVTLQNYSVDPSTTLQLIADMSGYFAPTGTGSRFTPLANAARIMDTRSGLGGSTGKLAAGKTDVLTIAGADGGALPSTGITAVALNLTATGTGDAGFLTVYADGSAEPGTSDLNWQGATTKPTAVLAPVGSDGKIDITNGSDDGGSADVLADVSGYFTATSTGSVYVPIAPVRVLDTRKGSKVAANYSYILNMNSVGAPFTTGMGGLRLPITAYVTNATVTDTEASGWLSAGSGPAVPPATSNLNWSGSGQTTANLAYAISEPNGTQDAYYARFYNGGGSISKPVDLLVDVMGYFSSL